MRTIYVASSWRNRYQPGVVLYLRSLGHQVYDFRHPTEGYDNPTGVTAGFLWGDLAAEWQEWTVEQYHQELTTSPIASAGFQSDWQAMEWADTGVLVLPSGASSHLEAGYFVGKPGKELHVLLPVDHMEPELMYLMADGIHLHLTDLEKALAVPNYALVPS